MTVPRRPLHTPVRTGSLNPKSKIKIPKSVPHPARHYLPLNRGKPHVLLPGFAS